VANQASVAVRATVAETGPEALAALALEGDVERDFAMW
jgi:hypothetical protein